MAYDTSKLASLQALKDTATRIKKEYLAAISKAGHASFQKAEAIPTAEEAQENILYLVKNTETSHYDIYALVDGTVELLDDTTVNLDGCVTDEELATALAGLGGGALYEGTKSDLSASDSSVIEAYFAAHTDITPKSGDVFVVTTIVGDKEYEKSAYQYTGTAWEAMTGNVDADKVIMRENLMLAGDYDRIGNWTKDKNGTATKEVSGKSVAAILKDLTSKTLQPTITANPSINGFGLSGAGAVEAGTPVATASYLAASLNPGSYKYGPKAGTGVVASNWKVERISENKTAIANLKKYVGTLPEGATATDVVGYIAEAIAALSIGDYAKTTEVTAAINTALAEYAKTSDVNTGLGKKADKVAKATNGNFAALDADGNLKDSGKKAADFVAAEAGKRLMTDAEGTKLGGVAEGATKVEASETNGNVKINGVDTKVYTEPSDVVHGTVATDSEVTEMLNEVFAATV